MPKPLAPELNPALAPLSKKLAQSSKPKGENMEPSFPVPKDEKGFREDLFHVKDPSV